MTLIEFVTEHTRRGECQCGRCIDKGNKPDPEGHTVDMIFFKVAAFNNPNRELFLLRTREKIPYVLDGNEHSYIRISADLGSQTFALLFMGLGALLGVFRLLTPRTMFGLECPENLVMNLAESGLVTITAK